MLNQFSVVVLMLSLLPRGAVEAAQNRSLIEGRQTRGAGTPPSRETMLRNFRDPPAEYRPIDCWWWDAGHLSEERIRWQLEELKAKGVGGTWYYPRFVRGQPLSCVPHYWTDEWWGFTKFAMNEHRRLGMRAWFSDWTAHQFFQNSVREEAKKDPSLVGRRLLIHEAESSGEERILIEIPEGEEVLTAAAYRKIGNSLDPASRVGLEDAVRENKLAWKTQEAGWLLAVVTSAPFDLNYLDRRVAERWLKHGLGEYEHRLGDLLGNPLGAYGADELFFMFGDTFYSPLLKARFETDKGYDPTAELPGLFHDIGSRTDKIRCDYYEIMNTLLEENWYAPIPEWLKARGMIYTNFCPIGKSNDILQQTYHFGDFFRRMRHFDISGAEEQAGRPHNFTFFAKTASSIAHLYGRKRTGVCAYWGSGWGHTTAENLAWTHEHFAYGVNFYDRHGGLYTTLGGWYEWVPPAVHFRQPYWQYWKHFTDYISRLSYVMSQGVHVSDVAVLYPLTTVHANWTGGDRFAAPARQASMATVNLAECIYETGIDFDYVDEPSLEKAEVRDATLGVAGLEFRAVVMPSLTTIRMDSLLKIKAFYDCGGTIVAYGRLPNASPENGRDDPNIRSVLRDLFGIADSEPVTTTVAHKNERGGQAFFVPDGYQRTAEVIANAIVTDVETAEKNLYHTHQKAGDLHIYYFYNHTDEARRVSVLLRVAGEPEIWDPTRGEIQPVHRFEKVDGRTRVEFDMQPRDAVVLVMTPPVGRPRVVRDTLTELTSVKPGDDHIKVLGLAASGGRKEVRVVQEDREYAAEVSVNDPPASLHVEGPWACRLEPTMNNRWGDFRYPASDTLIGTEARRFRYREEVRFAGTSLGWHRPSFDDRGWVEQTYSYGPYFWTIGPFREDHVPRSMVDLARQGLVDPGKAYGHPFRTRHWERYRFSRKFGAADKEAHSDWAGLRGVSENFLILKKVEGGRDVVRCFFTHVHSSAERDYLFDFGGDGTFPRKAWINGKQVIPSAGDVATKTTVRLPKGWSSLLLKIVQPKGETVRAFAGFLDPSEPPFDEPTVPRLRWFARPLPLTWDIKPASEGPVGWYRFKAPPGLAAMRFKLDARAAQVWVDGRPVWRDDQIDSHGAADEIVVHLDEPASETSHVAVRVEQKPGVYGGAAFPEPVRFDTAAGRIPLGDWCEYGLETYSGCVLYTTTILLTREHLAGRVILDLGRVLTVVDVRINGKSAAVLMAPPYACDISDLAREGANSIEVKVANTLANHMSTYPTKFVYDGQTRSGLLGPVELRFVSNVTLTALPLRE